MGTPPVFVADLASVVPPCFAAGTRIATPNGAVPVERLRDGNTVLTVSGGRWRISWIGHRRVDCRRHPNPDRVMPIRIAPHAFGQGRPQRPVLLSPDHAVFVEDVLIPIKFLVNGHTITQIELRFDHVLSPRTAASRRCSGGRTAGGKLSGNPRPLRFREWRRRNRAASRLRNG